MTPCYDRSAGPLDISNSTLPDGWLRASAIRCFSKPFFHEESINDLLGLQKCLLICIQPKMCLAFGNSIRPNSQKIDTGSVFCQNQFCKQPRVQTGLWLRKTEICQNLILVNKKWVINSKWGQNPLFEMAVDKSRDIFKGQDHFYWIPRKK